MLSIPDLFRNMQNCTDYLASKGIGAIHTVSGVGFIANLVITIEKLFAKSLRNGFQIRVFPQALNTGAATSRRIPRIGVHVTTTSLRIREFLILGAKLPYRNIKVLILPHILQSLYLQDPV